MTDYEQRLELEELVTEAYLSASKPLTTLPVDDEEVDLDDELEDDGDENDEEVEAEVSVCPISKPLTFPNITCEEQELARKNFMIISDSVYKLKELAGSSSFLDVFEPWMLEKLAVIAADLNTLVNTAKFNDLDTAE